jgi:hypothetical protein
MDCSRLYLLLCEKKTASRFLVLFVSRNSTSVQFEIRYCLMMNAALILQVDLTGEVSAKSR